VFEFEDETNEIIGVEDEISVEFEESYLKIDSFRQVLKSKQKINKIPNECMCFLTFLVN